MELLERQGQLAELDGWLQEAAAGGGRVALVGGEAGVDSRTEVAEAAARLGFASQRRGPSRPD